jgi:Ni,Fe-hydrogenase III small subunit
MAETWVAHIHAGGCDACLREWEAAWQEAADRGWQRAPDPAEAAVLVVTGVPNELGAESLGLVLTAWAADGPGTLLLVGDCAINGGLWAKLGAPGVLAGVDCSGLSAEVRLLRVPGDPPSPAAILAGLDEALRQ